METLYQFWRNLKLLNRWQTGVLLFFLAFVVRLTLIVVFHPYRDLARYELERTAISLATTGVFGNPYAIPTGPTAHVSPGYTIILAALFRLFSTSIPAEIVKELLASAVTALQCALLPTVADSLSLDRQAGILAGLVCALIPSKPFVQIDGDWETPYTALFILFTLVLAARTWKRCRLTTSFAVLNGIVWGFALLFASVLLPIFALFVLAGAFFCRSEDYKRYLAFAAIQTSLVALCLAPWVIRNNHALGAPIATRSNFGLELRVSNNDEATPDQRVNYLLGVYDRYHPLQNEKEAFKVRQLGEVAYNQEAAREAKNWIHTHIRQFVYLCIGRIRCFWLYPDPSLIKALFGDITAILGLAGFLVVLRKNLISGVAVGIVLLLYPAPSYLIHVGARQRYPIDWLLTTLSIVSMIQIWKLFQAHRRSTRSGVVA
jgi:hypothetical protein